jgi:PAS domain S-box-containing protein
MNAYPDDELSVTLFEEAGDALLLFDSDTEQVLDANPMAQRLSGFSRQELLQMPLTNLIRADGQDGLQRLRHNYQKIGLFHSQDGFWLRQQQDGAWVPVELTITRLHGEPKPLGLVTARDIREHRNMSAQLQRADSELRRVLASVSDYLWSAVVDPSGQATNRYYSPVVEKITGRPPEFFQVGPERWLSTVYEEDRPRIQEVVDRILAGLSTGEEEEYRVVRPDGSLCWVRDSVRVSRCNDGRSLRLDGIVTDISDRKRAETTLRESEERYRQLVELCPDAIFINTQRRIVFANAAAARLVGASGPEQLLGRGALDFIHPDYQDIVRDRLHTIESKHAAVPLLEEKFVRLDGQVVEVEVAAIPFTYQGRPAVQAIARDISQRKRAEEALARERDLLHVLMNSIPQFIYFKDRESRFTQVNQAQARNLGLDEAAAALGKTDFDFYPEELAREFNADERQIIQTGQPLIDKVERQTGDDATERWLTSTKVPIFGPDGRITGLVGISRDVTERQRAEEALRASEAKYRCLIENLEQSIFLKDRDLRFVAANRVFCQEIGAAEADLVGKTDFDFFPRRVAEKHQADDRRVLAEGRRLELEEQCYRHGRPHTLRIVKNPVKDAQGRTVGVLGIFWDVTEQRTLEAQLRQAQKMEAVGQLAGGVAHDFNNLLTVILGNVALVRAGLPTGGTETELLAATEKAALRAAELTSKLLGFSRKTTLRLEPTTLDCCLDETLELLRHTIDPRITVQVRKAPQPWLVQADVAQLTQVLMNLCLNARDAMPNGGTLELETENVVLDREAVRLQLDAHPGEHVCLRVRDTGVGIPPENLPRIFEPFFTTKAPDKGTGLGLAMVFGIIKQHHGWITCCSKVGEGSRFDLYLPRYQPQTETVVAPPDGRPTAARGHETILLVDDEPMIRNLGRTILQRYGYQVLLAEDGLQAVEVFRRHASGIDLVILDLTMPRLSGRDAFRRLRQLDPDVRVLFASGYSAEHLTEEEHTRVLGFVSKPYRPQELAQRVREALDRARSQREADKSWRI